MYRRAPELRRFSDEDLARLAAEMVGADTPRRWGGQPENALVLLVFLFGFFLLLFVFDEFSPGWMRRGSGPSPLGWAVACAWVVCWIPFGFAADAWASRLGDVRRVRRMLRRIRCRRCRGVLDGTVGPEATVACRACGTVNLLGPAVTGVDQIIAWARGGHLTPRLRRECVCRYPLGELPVVDGAVRCPECGEGYAVRGGGFVRVEAARARVGG